VEALWAERRELLMKAVFANFENHSEVKCHRYGPGKPKFFSQLFCFARQGFRTSNFRREFSSQKDMNGVETFFGETINRYIEILPILN
jgi:hypothetical protein